MATNRPLSLSTRSGSFVETWGPCQDQELQGREADAHPQLFPNEDNFGPRLVPLRLAEGLSLERRPDALPHHHLGKEGIGRTPVPPSECLGGSLLVACLSKMAVYELPLKQKAEPSQPQVSSGEQWFLKVPQQRKGGR